MAITMPDELLKTRKTTDDYLSNLAVQNPQNVQQTRTNLEGLRSNFLSGALEPQIGGMSGAAAAYGQANTTLGRSLDSSLAARTRADQTGGIDKIFQTALRRAEEAGLNYQDAQQYAREEALKVNQRGFDAEQADLNRQSSTRKQDVADRYAKQGIALQNQYAPGTDFQSVLARALGGLGGSVGTGLLLRKYGQGSAPQTLAASGPTAGVGSSGIPSDYGSYPGGVAGVNDYGLGGR